jgi:hypothetical protein
MTPEDPLLRLLSRLRDEKVEYVLVGGQAVRLNGYLRATEDVDLLVDLLFAANGETYESVQPYVREVLIDGTPVRVLNIDGLIKTKTDYREKDVLDKRVLTRIKDGLASGE